MHDYNNKVRKMILNTLQIIAITILVAYGILSVIALIFSGRMIFPNKPSSYTDNHRIIKIPFDNEKKISGIYLPNEQAQYTLLYSHGNYEDIGELYSTFEDFQQMGYSVFAYDYPGYGTSDGRATEKDTYLSINAAYAYLIGKLEVKPEKIIAFGRSVGGGPAVDLASRKLLGGLILESTFVSAFRVLTKYSILPWDKFNNINKINSVSCPILFIHGKNDEVVSFWHGKTLMEKANNPKLYLWVEGAGHNDIVVSAGKTYWDTLDKFQIHIKKYTRNLKDKRNTI